MSKKKVKKNKKRIFFIIILVIIISLLATFYLNWVPKEDISDIPMPEEIEIDFATSSYYEVMYEANKPFSVNKGESFDDALKRCENTIISPVCRAFTTYKEEDCKKLFSNEMIIDCMATATNNASHCYEHEEQDEINQCLGELLEDPSYCDKIKNEEYKAICLAFALKNSDKCKSIEDKNQRFYCIAETSKNKGECDKIDNDYQKNTCKAELSGDLSYCEKAKTALCKNKLYEDFAVMKEDMDYCRKIEFKYAKSICAKNILDLNINNTNSPKQITEN